jgi:Cof subfamily protein (haloacid dehalogenase superfamily)
MMPSVEKLVFVDFDGTLLDSKRRLTPTTRAAVEWAVESGVVIVPASSRPLAGLRLASGPEFDMAIALNGAVVQRRADEPPSEQEPMSEDDVATCLTLGRRLSLCCNVYTAGEWFTYPGGHQRAAEEERRIGVRPRPLVFGCLPQAVHKVLFLGARRELDRYEERLRTETDLIGRLNIFRSEASYLEIGRHDVSKGVGLRTVQKWCPARRTYAIGDGHADLAMFSAVDVAIAVDNALASVKERAHRVCPGNDADGVRDALGYIIEGAW